MDREDESVSILLAKRDEATFEQVFKSNFKRMHAYAFTILQDDHEAEEAVQQVFFRLWERNENLNINGPLAAYLYRAVHNQCLNQLRHLKVRSAHHLQVVYQHKNRESHPVDQAVKGELEQKIRSALQELPEQCRTVFQLSRFEELKYRDIAERLGISVKTVENQMGKALKILRARLVEYLSYLLAFIHF